MTLAKNELKNDKLSEKMDEMLLMLQRLLFGQRWINAHLRNIALNLETINDHFEAKKNA